MSASVFGFPGLPDVHTGRLTLFLSSLGDRIPVRSYSSCWSCSRSSNSASSTHCVITCGKMVCCPLLWRRRNDKKPTAHKTSLCLVDCDNTGTLPSNCKPAAEASIETSESDVCCKSYSHFQPMKYSENGNGHRRETFWKIGGLPYNKHAKQKNDFHGK